MSDLPPGDSTPACHVIHLPVVVPTLDAATELAAWLTESLASLPELDAGEVTVSPEDAQHERRRVFCDRLLPGRARCGQREAHPGRCVPRHQATTVPATPVPTPPGEYPPSVSAVVPAHVAGAPD